MKTLKNLPKQVACALALSVLLAGCGTGTEVASDIGLGGGGGVLGYKLSDGDAGVTAAGAVAGYVISKVAQSKVQQAITAAEQRGYDRAMNQSVKQHYWIIQNQQREQGTERDKPERLVPVQLPETTINGVILNPTVEFIRV
jgi:hypothetical protein